MLLVIFPDFPCGESKDINPSLKTPRRELKVWTAWCGILWWSSQILITPFSSRWLQLAFMCWTHLRLGLCKFFFSFGEPLTWHSYEHNDCDHFVPIFWKSFNPFHGSFAGWFDFNPMMTFGNLKSGKLPIFWHSLGSVPLFILMISSKVRQLVLGWIVLLDSMPQARGKWGYTSIYCFSG